MCGRARLAPDLSRRVAAPKPWGDWPANDARAATPLGTLRNTRRLVQPNVAWAYAARPGRPGVRAIQKEKVVSPKSTKSRSAWDFVFGYRRYYLRQDRRPLDRVIASHSSAASCRKVSQAACADCPISFSTGSWFPGCGDRAASLLAPGLTLDNAAKLSMPTRAKTVDKVRRCLSDFSM